MNVVHMFYGVICVENYHFEWLLSVVLMVRYHVSVLIFDLTAVMNVSNIVLGININV